MNLHTFRHCVFLLALLGVSAPARADIYKWVDEDGNIHFGDRAPVGQQAERRESSKPAPAPSPGIQKPVSEKQRAGFGGLTEPQNSPSKEKGPLPKNAKVEMYTTSWCGYCKKAREFFNANGILFTDYDIEKDSAAMERRLAMGSGKSVPIVIINGTMIRGYSPAGFEAALRQ